MEKKQRVLNVLVAGHAQHGKSSLIEAICGTFPDNLNFELAHGTTVSLKVVQFELKKQNLLFNFLDSPGHADFKGGIALGLEFADLLILVISGTEGFQARSYWLFEKASQKRIPIVIAATKMDLPSANTVRISNELIKLTDKRMQIISTSAKQLFGIEALIQKLSIQVKIREKIDSNLTFIILGFSQRKGIGDLMSVGIFSGQVSANNWISEKIKIRQLFTLKGVPTKHAVEGEIVQLSLNVSPNFALGTIYRNGKFISSKIIGFLSEIHPRKEFYIKIEDPDKFKVALDVLEKIKKLIPSFDYYVENQFINVLVQGDLQFDLIKERFEDLIDFKVIGSKIKGIITINSQSKAKFKSAAVRIVPRCKKTLTISRDNGHEKKLYDILGASAAYEAFHLDGLHVDIFSGRNEDDIAQAIAKAIEKVKIIKIIPHQDIIVKVENYNDIFQLISKYDIELLHQSQTNSFFLQVKNDNFEPFFNSLMKISNGKAEINLFKFEQDNIILSVDPGTRHYGFCLIEKGELPLLWYVNLKTNIENIRSHDLVKKQIARELDTFLGNEKDLINKIYIGNGPGSSFIIEFFIEYLNIPCEDNKCIITDLNSDLDQKMDVGNTKRFTPPDIFLVDEFKTTKEALFHLQQGNLVSEVKSKGFVDHAIAALLIAKRGIRGEVMKIDKKPLKQLYDYVIENYSGSYSFATIHNINNLDDLKPGMYLKVKDSSKLDSSSLNNGDIFSFTGFGSSYNSIHGSKLSGNRIIVKFQGGVKVKRDFFKILVPVKERN